MNYNEEWDYEEEDFIPEWIDDDAIQTDINKKTLSNDYFLIHRASSIDFKTYIINEINKINSYLSTIKEVLFKGGKQQ